MKNIRHFFILCFSQLILFSCQNQTGKENTLLAYFKPDVIKIDSVGVLINNKLHTGADFPELLILDSTISMASYQSFYNVHENQAVWFDNSGIKKNAVELMAEIEGSINEGLIPEDYYFKSIDSLYKQFQSTSLTNRDISNFDLYLSYAYLKFGKDLLLGRIEPLHIDKNWQSSNDTLWQIDSFSLKLNNFTVVEIMDKQRPRHPWYKKFKSLSERLSNKHIEPIDFSAIKTSIQFGDSIPAVSLLRQRIYNTVDKPKDTLSDIWDSDIVDALKLYQYVSGLEPTGTLTEETIVSLNESLENKKRQLAMNMERMRWLTKDFQDEFIWVNIPKMELEYFEKDSVRFHMNVVVGRIGRNTPMLDSRLSNIVFNPPWFVPPTIMAKDVLPGLARRGGSYLRRKGLVARDSRGRVVNPSLINAKNYRYYSISQNPGVNSALGSVKFNFPNKEAIFLHDTNHRGDFNKKYRAFSSGCIRVHHPKDFAEFILRDTTYSQANIDSLIVKRKTKSVDIDRTIGVHIVYMTNAVDSVGNIIQVKDIYKWDEKLRAFF